VGSVTQPLADAAGSVTQPIADVAGSVTQPIADAAGSITQPIADAAGSVTPTLTDAVGSVTQPLADAAGSVTQPIADAIGSTTAPLAGAAGSLTQTLTHAAGSVTHPLADAAGSAPASLSHAATTLTQPVADAIGQPLATAVTSASQAVAQSGGPVLGAVGSATQPIVEGVTSTARPVADAVSAAAGSLGSVAAHTTDVVSSTGTAIAAATGSAANAAVTPAATLADDTLGLVAGSTADGARAAIDVSAGGLTGAESSLHHLASAVTAIGPDPSVLPFLAAGGAGALAMWITVNRVRLMLEYPGATRILFTNVRLIPCHAPHVLRAQAASVADGGSRLADLGREVGSSMVDSVSSGFRQARSRATSAEHGDLGIPRVASLADGGEGSGDNRFLVQLGLVLGMAYLAFLTVWFWATRLRVKQREA
jgi:hypothetical protein